MRVKTQTYSNFKKIKQDDITYLLNEEEKTAGVFKYVRKGYHKVYIPRSIHHESKEYVIISILKEAFQFTDVESIQFSNDSEIRTFERGCFFFASFESLQIPSTVIDLKEGWCDGIRKPSNITISLDNPRYKMYDNSFIIGKSTMEQDDYDVLVLCVKNKKKVKIPSFIKIFSSYSFEGSRDLHELEFSEDSELHTIEENALPTDIKSLYIPPKLINLKKHWCSGTSDLNKIKVSPNNPKYKVYNDEFLIGKSSLEQKNYNVLALSVRSIQDVKIPSFIEEIGSSAFFLCQKIKNFEFQKDSKLRIINANGFCRSSIIKMTLPSHLTKICEDAFFDCSIEKIEIPINSELQSIEKEAFADSHIKVFFIPPLVTMIGENAFNSCADLQIIEFNEKLELFALDFLGISHNCTIIMIPVK